MIAKKCKVCGFELDYYPWGKDGQSPTYNICQCCGTEAGYDDVSSKSIMEAKERWLKNPKWFNELKRPEKWDIQKQLKNVLEDTNN